jgi:hypothetical protein
LEGERKMERLVYMVEQIDEAGRLLGLKSAPHARMALLLLDSAVEILMYRTVMDELWFDDAWSSTVQSARASLPPDKAEVLIQESGYTPIPAKQRKAMKRLFVPKVDFLVRNQKVPQAVGQVIKALHRYRNDAHHRDKVRSETVHAAAVIYYEVACELLATLLPTSMVFSGGDDWSGFLSRFGLGPAGSMTFDDIAQIASKLRCEIGIEAGSLAQLLSDHLVSRLDGVYEQLDFICENVGSGATPASELKHVQFWKATGSLPDTRADERFVAYAPKYTLDRLDEWRRSAEQLRTRAGEGKLNLLREFCEIEQELEPLEEMVNEVASLIDRAIQLEIDMALGK